MTDATDSRGVTPPRLHLLLSGRPAASATGRPSLPLASRDAALLAWLALEGPTARVRLAGMLWPQSDHEAALGLLRQRLFQLKRRLGRGVVEGAATLSLAADVGHDLDGSTGVLGDMALEWGGPLVTWLEQRRAGRRELARGALIERIERAEDAQDWPAARRDLDVLLALDPLSEDAHRRLVRHHYVLGDRAAALLAFDRCEQVLKDQVGTAPSAPTLALLATVMAGGAIVVAAPDRRVPAALLRPPRLIGRDRELADAARAWESGHVLAVIGEAGLGKSRLLQEFAAGRAGVVRVAARPGDAEVPLATLARLLRSVVALRPDALPTLESLPRQALERVLPELQSGTLGGDSVHPSSRIGLVLGLHHFLAAVAGLRGLVVDDLHFADAASLELIASLLGEPEIADSALRWAFAWRPIEAASPVAALQDGLTDAALLAPLPLAPLDLAALEALVDTLGLPGATGERLAPVLLRRTGGNPMFVLETLKQAWVEHGVDALAGGEVSARSVTVGRLIERRLAQLTPGALALARVASIAGVDFSVALAEHVLGASALQFADALGELERAQVLQGDAFAHDLVFETVAAGVPATIARHAHAQIAQWLAGREGEPARVARHWIDGGRPEQALEWLVRAADAALLAHRVREHVAFLDTKSTIEHGLGRREDAFSTLRAAANVACNYELHVELGEALFARLDGLAANELQQVTVAALRAQLHVQRGEPAAAIDVASQALRAAHLLGDAATTMTLRATLGTAEMMLGHSLPALQHLEVCVAWFDENGKTYDRASLHGDLGVLYDNLGRLEDAHAHLRLAEKLSRASGDLDNLGVVCINLGRNRLLAGDLVNADLQLQQSEQLALAHDSAGSQLAGLRLMRAVCHSHLGRHADALRQAELALEAAQRQQPGLIGHAHVRMAYCWASLGQWARVRQALIDVDPFAAASPVVRIGRVRMNGWYANAVGDASARAQAGADLAREHAALGAGSRPDLRMPLEIQLAEALPPDEALPRLDALRREAEGYGHRAIVLATRLRAAAAATVIAPERAIVEARAALALQAQGIHNTALMPAELWWRVAEAFEAGGEHEEAARVANDGAAWLERIATEHVPEAFRRGFLERQPANRALLAVAARLGRR